MIIKVVYTPRHTVPDAISAMSKGSATKVKPCPFCFAQKAHVAHHFGLYKVTCQECDATVSACEPVTEFNGVDDGIERHEIGFMTAINAWNDIKTGGSHAN